MVNWYEAGDTAAGSQTQHKPLKLSSWVLSVHNHVTFASLWSGQGTAGEWEEKARACREREGANRAREGGADREAEADRRANSESSERYVSTHFISVCVHACDSGVYYKRSSRKYYGWALFALAGSAKPKPHSEITAVMVMVISFLCLALCLRLCARSH